MLFTQALRDYRGDHNYVFDPEGFVTDEHGANRESIRQELKPGAVDRAKSCEKHFYDCARRQENGDSSSSSRVKFRQMIHELYHAPTPGSFEARRQHLMNWVQEKPSKRGHIKTWFAKFWHKRRAHVFHAFKSARTPNTNMAEPGHSRNATRVGKDKTLATVAEEHIVECALLKAKIDQYEEGTYKGGHCSSQREKDVTTFRRQRERANQFAEELQSVTIQPELYSCSSYIDPGLSHGVKKRSALSFEDEPDGLSESSPESDERDSPRESKTVQATYRKRTKRSKVFEKSLSMARKTKRINLVNIHHIGKLQTVFETNNNGRPRMVEISQSQKCDCGMVSARDICMHVV